MSNSIICSFCHGYRDESVIQEKRVKIPSILYIDPSISSIQEVVSLYYPRLPKDFSESNLGCPIVGNLPDNSSAQFKRKPRFGIMGLSRDEAGGFYAASWNGIYYFDGIGTEPSSFITHNLINDPHGIAVDGDYIYSVLTPLDSLVCTNRSTGNVEWAVRFDRNLNCISLSEELNYDWRFIGKQNRGAVGNFHFNNVVVREDKLWLTSRLTSSVVEFDPSNSKAILRTFCWDTPVMIHDGENGPNNSIVFTSVDGKILETNSPQYLQSSMPSMKEEGFVEFMQRDLITRTLKLSEIKGHEINWCRGYLYVDPYHITTLYGRYDQSTPYFSIFKINSADPTDFSELKVSYDLLDYPSEIRYMTGFSII